MTKRKTYSPGAVAKKNTSNSDVTESKGEKKRVSEPMHLMQSRQYSGPIPPPEMLQEYNNIVPDAAERILAMAEAGAKHQREMEAGLLVADIESDKRRHIEVLRGQLFAGAAVVVAFSVAALALFLGSPAAATLIGGTTVISLVTVFVTGRKEKPVVEDPQK